MPLRRPESVGRHAKDAALFVAMLSLPEGGRYPAVELRPQWHRQKALEALCIGRDGVAEPDGRHEMAKVEEIVRKLRDQIYRRRSH